MVVSSESVEIGDIVKMEHRWCKKCGCLTQVGVTSDGELVVAVGEDGAPHLAVPRILDLVIK
jgi:hypothetical protein